MRIFRKMSLRPPWSIFIITQKPKIIFKSNQSHWKANKIIYNFHVYTKSQFKTKNGAKIVTACAKSCSDFAKSCSDYLRMKMQILTQKIVLRFSKSYSDLTAFPVSRSCIFFTRFCFELAFGVNMKVVDN